MPGEVLVTGHIRGIRLESMTDSDKLDRRIRRTQEALRAALVELIAEKGFESISVAEIAERADVGRSTFYAHYADKEDLLQGSVDGLRAFLAERVDAIRASPEPGVHPALAFCLPMLEHADEQRALFHAMVGRRSGYLFQELSHDMWVDFVRAGWPDADDVAVQAIAGGFGSVIHWWLTQADDLGPRDVFERFRALIEPALP